LKFRRNSDSIPQIKELLSAAGYWQLQSSSAREEILRKGPRRT
jgi:hypothetical protein